MNSQGVLSEDKRKFLSERLKGRITEVHWGYNASTVEEVFFFTEDYILGDISDVNVREQICKFLFSEGMLMQFKINNRDKGSHSMCRVWYLKARPQSEFLLDIWEYFAHSLQDYKANRKLQAREIFDETWRELMSIPWRNLTLFDVRNTFDREFFAEFANEAANNFQINVFYMYCAHDKFLISLNNDFGYWPQKFSEEYKNYAMNAVKGFPRELNMYINMESVNPLNRRRTRPKYVMWHCEVSMFEYVQRSLERLGYHAYIFPRRRPEEYFKLQPAAYTEIPIYLEGE